ncbi:MAG: N-acetyltransferase [Chloroflexota bacterium]|nr:N-acetyltransferase [Chloroflexota bacterium]MDE3193183.1 N-acetyltransferase [Chloroflexota bacterium]
MSERFPGAFVHPSASVEDGVEIGAGSRVFINVQIRTGAKIGRDCILGKDVFVDAGVTIGDRVKIQNGVSVYRGVTLEDEVFLGPHCVTTNDLDPASVTPDGRLKTEADWRLGETVFRTGARIGAGAIVVCGDPRREIGRWALVAAGAVVARDVRDFELVAGNPARPLRYVCPSGLDHEVAMVANGTSGAARPVCRVCQKILYEVVRR